MRWMAPAHGIWVPKQAIRRSRAKVRLTHQASELSLLIADFGYRNWTLSSVWITFEDKLEIVRMGGT